MKEKLKVYHFADLEAAGYGVRATVSKRVKMGTFPSPLDDGMGRPIWTDEMLERHNASLDQYHPEPIKHIEQTRSAS